MIDQESRKICGSWAVLGIALLPAVLALPAAAAEATYGAVVPPGATSGDLTLAPCEVYMDGDDRSYAADCGTLVVPENRNNPGSRLIALPVARIPATAGAPLEPIFWFQGGPGSPNQMAYPSDGLFERHDFVMVGYRGIDGEVVLECPEIAEAIRSVKRNPLSDAALDTFARSAADCSQRIAEQGIDLDGYSMNQTIDDMEAARVALGYGRINLFGNSYGTRLEMIYQWRYPAAIHRVVMVAVNPPGHFIFDPAAIRQQLGDYSVLCANNVLCRSRTSDLVATMEQVSRNMPSRWMGIRIDPAAVRLVTFVSLMESMPAPGEAVPLNGPAAIDLWLDAAEGDASGMALVSLAAPLFLPSLGARPHFLAMGGSAPETSDPHRNYRAELTRRDEILGSPFSLFVSGLMQGWPSSTDQSYGEVQLSDIETLLISGSIDGSTPMQFARDELLPRLSNGHQVVLQDQGHTETFWNSQPEARARLLNTFLDSGRVDDSLYEYQAVIFDVDRTWGGMAKMLLGLFVLVVGLVVLTVIVVGRRALKARASRRGLPG